MAMIGPTEITIIIGVVLFILIFVIIPFIKGYRKGPKQPRAGKSTAQKQQALQGKPEPVQPIQTPSLSAGDKFQSGFGTDQIFISYRRVDSADVTGRIYDRLVAQFGESAVFKDVDSIPLGLDFKEHLDETVGKCSIFLIVIGNRWLSDGVSESQKSRLDDPRDFVRIEIESALRRNIPVIPLLVGGASIPSLDQLPQSLQNLVYRNGIAIRPDPDFHRDMDRLISAIEQFK
jgi:hypothetical protein